MQTSDTTLPASAAAVRALFRQRFGREPDTIASAPGRVNLIGEHTDYNGGEVLPIGIERRTWVAAGVRREGGGMLRAVSANEDGAGEASLVAPTRSEHWWDYLTGVAAPIARDALGSGALAGAGIDAAVTSDVPTGAGLSSSAAIEVATALAVAKALGGTLEPREAAMIGWRAETGFVGVASGIMDQFASALSRQGEALHLDCATTETELVPFRDAVLIIDSAVRRSLRDSAFNTRQAECAQALRLMRERWPKLPSLAAATPEQVLAARLPAPLDRRALHVSRETRRVQEAVTLLRAGKPLSGELLLGSHESLRDLYECSRPELDWLVARSMLEPGVRGARLTGAGWGGCMIVVGDESALAAAGPKIGKDYEKEFGLTARLWLSRAAEGARVEEV
ncbi:MAG: galactokinase [Gemmatimonadaceae bacterium]|nr:galactokinase [Gemmatimonadaceae bacterium]